MNHDENDEAAWSRACDYVFGIMTAAEAGEFEQHLRDGCAACSTLMTRAREIEGGLGLAATPVAPRPELRAELLARVGAAPSEETQVWRRWQGGDSDWRVVRAEEGGFEPTKIPGIEVRRLSVDDARQQVTMMIRMAPGTRYPPHRHGGREECFVLSGDLRHADQVMHGGDYEVVERGTIHGEQWTEGGCMLLIHSSMHDELLV